MEVVDLKNKNEQSNSLVKLKNSSSILDEVLDCQIFPFDKSILGYNKEEEKYEFGTWNPNTSEKTPSLFKR